MLSSEIDQELIVRHGKICLHYIVYSTYPSRTQEEEIESFAPPWPATAPALTVASRTLKFNSQTMQGLKHFPFGRLLPPVRPAITALLIHSRRRILGQLTSGQG